MSIKKDAGEILIYTYNRYLSSNFQGINKDELIKETGWEKSRLKRAVDYLRQKGLIKVILYIGGGFWIREPNPEGIDIVEHQEEFKEKFGFEINLGLFKFSWSQQEK